MSQQLDGDQIQGIGELLVRVLPAIQLRAGREAVDEHQGGFGRVVWLWHLVGGVYAAEMRHMDSLGVWHDRGILCGGYSADSSVLNVTEMIGRSEILHLYSRYFI